MKKIILSAFILFILSFVFAYFNIYDNKDTCLDTGFCREGLIINTEKGQILINEQTCKSENGVWDDKKRACRLK